MSIDHVIYETCFCCEKEYQFSFGIYYGKHIPRYKINVCMLCYQGSHDGWSPRHETKLIQHLKSNDMPIPEKNSKGYLPRD